MKIQNAYLRILFWMVVFTGLIYSILELKRLEDIEHTIDDVHSAPVCDTIPTDTICEDTIIVIDDITKIEVFATMYHPVVGQCDDTPDITADQTKIPNIDSCSHLNWIAVSQDLLWFNDGPIRYGDTVYVEAGHKTGYYIVRDAMNRRFRNKIDFLESVGTEAYRYTDAKLYINS